MEKITIIFGTVMGTAKGCAKKISETLTACNLENEVVDMEDYDHARLTEKGLLIVVTSTTGNGVPPSNAEALHSHLSSDNIDLAGRTFAVLSLGDSFRTHFAQCGKDFDRMLEGHGGTRVIDRIDSDGVIEAPLKQFINNLLDYFEKENELYSMFNRVEVEPEPSSTDTYSDDSSETKATKKKGILSRIKKRVVNKIRSLI